LRREAYDHVIANPPFFTHGHARLSKDARNARSRTMPEAGLDAWLRFLAGAAKPGGTATLIHTAEALPRLLTAFEGRFGGLRIIPLHPKADAAAIRVIIRGIKGSRGPISLERGIALHEQDGTPTEAAKAVLRDGSGLF
ncbi:MAG: methyltransferase, partial [Rhodomicrobium sp.]|nr:methyltransferase [Rhodomicrobium sp.]